MKKVFLIIVFTLFSFNIKAQEKINIDNLIGYWKPNEESSKLFFWKDINGKLQVQEICETTGQAIDLIRLKVNEYELIIDTIFKPNNWVIRSVFISEKSEQLTCYISGDTEAKIYYTKIK